MYCYGSGIIPRFSEVGDTPESKEFHTLRVQPPAGNYYSTDMLRQLGESWEKHGSGLQTFHGQTGNIMFIDQQLKIPNTLLMKSMNMVGTSVEQDHA